jgi:hypothetical protein
VTGAYPSPRRWTDDELEAAAVAATTDFVAERQAQGGAAYRAAYEEAIDVVRELFAASDDLRSLADGGALADNSAFVNAARYLDGPPVSQDDLETIVAVSAAADEAETTIAQHVAVVIVAGLDALRLPWLFEATPRAPTDVERDLAMRWTAGLWAVQRSATQRRGESSSVSVISNPGISARRQ